MSAKLGIVIIVIVAMFLVGCLGPADEYFYISKEEMEGIGNSWRELREENRSLKARLDWLERGLPDVSEENPIAIYGCPSFGDNGRVRVSVATFFIEKSYVRARLLGEDERALIPQGTNYVPLAAGSKNTFALTVRVMGESTSKASDAHWVEAYLFKDGGEIISGPVRESIADLCKPEERKAI